MTRPPTFIRLNPSQLAEITSFICDALVQKPPNPRVRKRGQAIWWSHQGKTIKQIAQWLHVTERSVRSWFSAYQHMGLKGLTDRPRRRRASI